MTMTHSTFQFYGGDDWEINATLMDENDQPYDLTGATILWTMITGSGQRVLDNDDFGISIIDAAAGKCAIQVTAAKTTTIPGGQYTDALRIVTGGITSTLSVGAIKVVTDPWRAAAATAQSVQLRVVG